VAQPNGAIKNRPWIKAGDLKITIRILLEGTNRKENARQVREPLTKTPAARNALCLIAADPAHAWR